MSIWNYISITVLSLLTTIIFVSAILYSDRKQREPIYMIILCLGSCIFTICLSLLLGQIILPKLEVISSGLFSYNTHNIVKILILALVEEYSKLLVLYLFISRNSNFDDIYDGFVYASLIALSFAALESIIYVFNEPDIASMRSLAMLRGITTVPLHLICGISMGYYMGVEKFSWGTKTRLFNLLKCLIVPTMIHFIYNYSLSNVITKFSSNDIVLVIAMIIFFIPFYLISFMFIKKTKFLNEKFISNEKYQKLMTKDEYVEIVSHQY